MKSFVAVAVIVAAVTAAPTPATAQYSCDQVRWFVSLVGLGRALRIARAKGMTPDQERRARSCLRG